MVDRRRRRCRSWRPFLGVVLPRGGASRDGHGARPGRRHRRCGAGLAAPDPSGSRDAGGSAGSRRDRGNRSRFLPAAFRFLIAGLFVAGASPSRAAEASRDTPRRFDDSSPIFLDVDGDGRLDRLEPRILELRRRFIPGAPRFPGGELERFVAFSLATARGRQVATVIQYRFGTENGGYSAYRMQAPGDLDGDGNGDLVFRVAGEPPEEVVVLLDRGSAFEARPSGPLRCACSVDDGLAIVERTPGGAPRRLGGWDVASQRFRGDEVVWIIGAEAVVRDGVTRDARELFRVEGGTAIRRLTGDLATQRAPGWLPVAVDDLAGWISERVVEPRSPASMP